ncbi:MAG TPA: hypothetical protein VK176_02835 [Phycisphaerales bacterium]|nr:hypothetical protein [Phycisphaerales bacterium]
MQSTLLSILALLPLAISIASFGNWVDGVLQDRQRRRRVSRRLLRFLSRHQHRMNSPDPMCAPKDKGTLQAADRLAVGFVLVGWFACQGMGYAVAGYAGKVSAHNQAGMPHIQSGQDFITQATLAFIVSPAISAIVNLPLLIVEFILVSVAYFSVTSVLRRFRTQQICVALTIYTAIAILGIGFALMYHVYIYLFTPRLFETWGQGSVEEVYWKRFVPSTRAILSIDHSSTGYTFPFASASFYGFVIWWGLQMLATFVLANMPKWDLLSASRPRMVELLKHTVLIVPLCAGRMLCRVLGTQSIVRSPGRFLSGLAAISVLGYGVIAIIALSVTV